MGRRKLIAGPATFRLFAKRTAAVLLFTAFLLKMAGEFTMLRFVKTAGGTWSIQMMDEPGSLSLAIFGTYYLLSIIAAALFICFSYERGKRMVPRSLTGWDAVYAVAWYQTAFTALGIVYGMPWAGGTLRLLETIEPYVPHVLMLATVLVYFRKRYGQIGLRRPRSWTLMVFVTAAVFFLISMLVTPFVAEPVSNFFSLEPESWREDTIKAHLLHGWLQVLFVGLMVPVAEEIFFRGVLQTALIKRVGAFFGILAASLLFAVIHIDIALLAPLFVYSLAMGILYWAFRSLWASVLFHVIMNTMSSLSFLSS